MGRPAEAWGARGRAAWAGFRVPWPDPDPPTGRSAGTRRPQGAPAAPFGLPQRPLARGAREKRVGPAGGAGGGRVTGRGRRYPEAARKPTPGTCPRWAREGGGGGKGPFVGPSAQLGGGGADSDQVRKKCAEPKLVCRAVSRFFEIPIQNNLSETQSVHQTPPSRAGDQSGVPGYMRKQKPWAGRKTGLGRSSPPAALVPLVRRRWSRFAVPESRLRPP